MKKMISIVLALFVCISSMGMFGILADGEVQVQAGTVQGASGDTVEVELTLTGNPGLSYLKLRIGYDASVLTLTNAENTGALGTADFTASENFGKNPYVLTWASASNLEGNGVIAKLTFEIDEDAASGSSEITVECADSNNEDLQDVAVTTVNGSVEISSIKPEFVLGNAEGSIGDTVEVALTLNNNPGISYFKVQVGYDAEKLALSEVKTNSNFSLTRGNPERNPYSVVFSSADGFNQDPPVNGEVCVLVFEILDKTSSIGTSDLQLLIEEVDSSVNPGEIFNITDRFSGTSGSVQINDVDCEHNFTIVSVDDNQHKKVCSICEREYFEAHTWDEGKVTKEPSCTEAGVKTYSCPVCDGTKTETIAALDHDWDEGKVTKEPSCTEAGVKTYSCSRCEETRTETIAALDHDWDEGKVTKEPSCTEAGEKNVQLLKMRGDENGNYCRAGSRLGRRQSDEGTVLHRSGREERTAARDVRRRGRKRSLRSDIPLRIMSTTMTLRRRKTARRPRNAITAAELRIQEQKRERSFRMRIRLRETAAGGSWGLRLPQRQEP